MMHQMSEDTREYRIKNEYIREKVEVVAIVKKIINFHHMLLGVAQVQRRYVEDSLKKVDQIEGKPKQLDVEGDEKKKGEVVSKRQILIVLTIDIIYDRTFQCHTIRLVDCI